MREHVNESAFDKFSGKVRNFFGLKQNGASRQGKQSIILAALYVAARVKFSAALADNNVTRRYRLATEDFYPEAFGNRITT